MQLQSSPATYNQALAHPSSPVLCVCVQDKCSLLQIMQPASCGLGASVSLVRCRGHQGVMHLESAPHYNIKALKCTNCSGCKECRQPLPLVIPEGTGGSGCSAEVAEKAEALRAALNRSNASSANSGGAGIGKASMHQQNAAAAGGSNAGDGDNPTLLECAVCHRKPGDPGVPATLKLCGGCQCIRYCSTDCQRKDWKLGLKEVCKQLVRSYGRLP
jgi:hypothetical protein